MDPSMRRRKSMGDALIGAGSVLHGMDRRPSASELPGFPRIPVRCFTDTSVYYN